MTDWVTIKHEKSIDPATGKASGEGHGGTAVVPKKSLPLYEKKGWAEVAEAAEPAVTPALKAAQAQQAGTGAQRS